VIAYLYIWYDYNIACDMTVTLSWFKAEQGGSGIHEADSFIL